VNELKKTTGMQKIMFLKTLHMRRFYDLIANTLPCQSINLLQSSNLEIEKSLTVEQIFVSGASIPKLMWACKSIEISLDPSPIAAVIGFSKIGCF